VLFTTYVIYDIINMESILTMESLNTYRTCRTTSNSCCCTSGSGGGSGTFNHIEMCSGSSRGYGSCSGSSGCYSSGGGGSTCCYIKCICCGATITNKQQVVFRKCICCQTSTTTLCTRGACLNCHKAGMCHDDI
jgi:hypothetical protein